MSGLAVMWCLCAPGLLLTDVFVESPAAVFFWKQGSFLVTSSTGEALGQGRAAPHTWMCTVCSRIS